MKYPIIILLFFYSTIKSQTFGGIYTSGYYATKDVQKEMDKAISKGQRKKEISSYNKTINDDTLSYIIQHNADPFVMKVVFNINDTILNEKLCDFQEYIFDCTPCSQKHLKEFIKFYNFREKSNNTYLSEYYLKTEMTVTYKSNDKGCLVITFRHVEMPKKQYKEFYKSLKNKTTT